MSKELIERLEAEEADEAGMFTGNARVVPMAVVKPIIEKLEAERDAFEKTSGEEAKKYLEEREKRIAAEAERDAIAAELKAVRGDQTPTTDDINLQEWKGMDGACAWHLIDRYAEDWHHTARLMNAWLEANREDLVSELKALREQSPAGKLHSDSIDGHVFIPTGGDWSCLGMSLYAHPVPARELTDETIQRHWDEACKDTPQTPGWSRHIRFARAIERYLKGEGE